MSDIGRHGSDIIFTGNSLLAFIKKIHESISNHYSFISTSDMAEKYKNNSSFNNSEQEIADIYTTGNSLYGWDTVYAANICIINNDFPPTGNAAQDRDSGRYTWLQVGNLLNFQKELSGKTEKNRPIGTIFVSENNGMTTHTVQVKGFKDNGDFSNARSNKTDPKAKISTNILEADEGNFDTVTANEGEFGKLTITGDSGITSSGKLEIDDTTEAKRYSSQTASLKSTSVSNDNFNIKIKITDTSKTYYELTGTGTYSSYTLYKLSTVTTSANYSLGTTFYVEDNSGTYQYVQINNSSTTVRKKIKKVSPSYTIVSKYFKTTALAQKYYSQQNLNSQCNTSTNYVNQSTFYIWVGKEPAPNYWDSKMVLEGSITTRGGIAAVKSIKGYRVHGSVFNDYAEYRHTNNLEPGRCVIETGKGDLILSEKRLQLGGNIISDTYGFTIGETEYANTPIAVCGRVLAYPWEEKETFKPGQAVCSGPNGTVSRMTRDEIRNWPDAIVGYVSEVPNYEEWGSDKIKVNNRIWIKVK